MNTAAEHPTLRSSKNYIQPVEMVSAMAWGPITVNDTQVGDVTVLTAGMGLDENVYFCILFQRSLFKCLKLD